MTEPVRCDERAVYHGPRLFCETSATDELELRVNASNAEVAVSQAVFLPESSSPATAMSAVRRVVFVALGVVCVGIGAVGVLVPGLPTAIWLIAASYLFMRSHPQLEAKLIRNRFFGPYLRYVDNPRSMPRRAKLVACGMMWCSVLASVTMLAWRGDAEPWLSAAIVTAATAGTWVIAQLRPAT